MYLPYDASWRDQWITIDARQQSIYGDIWVSRNDHFRFLTFGSPTFSHVQGCQLQSDPAYLVLPYMQMMMGIYWFCSYPKRILILGHGAGMMVSAHQKISPEARLDVVDIHPDIWKVSVEYFHFVQAVQTHAHVEDVLCYVNREIEPYDCIILDVFDKVGAPDKIMTAAFTLQLKKLLTPTGVLAINTFIKPEDHLNHLPYQLGWPKAYRLVEPLHQSNSVLFLLNTWRDVPWVRAHAKRWDTVLRFYGTDYTTLLPNLDIVDWYGDSTCERVFYS